GLGWHRVGSGDLHALCGTARHVDLADGRLLPAPRHGFSKLGLEQRRLRISGLLGNCLSRHRFGSISPATPGSLHHGTEGMSALRQNQEKCSGCTVMYEELEVHRKFADIAGSKMSYLDVGLGPVLVLVHSYLWAADMSAPQIRELSQRYRVIVPELWGHGQSGALPAGALTLRDIAQH